MTGACEFLSILMIVGASGGNELNSRCVATLAECDARWQAAADTDETVLGQCLSIDDLAAMRDAGRKDAPK